MCSLYPCLEFQALKAEKDAGIPENVPKFSICPLYGGCTFYLEEPNILLVSQPIDYSVASVTFLTFSLPAAGTKFFQ